MPVGGPGTRDFGPGPQDIGVTVDECIRDRDYHRDHGDDRRQRHRQAGAYSEVQVRSNVDAEDAE